MKAEEIEYIETEVKVNLMPEIKKAVPGVLGWVLRLIFPKLERKIIDFIIEIVEHFLSKKK
jgi:phage terminase Nu1 subunit (DNA packaging protein)